MVRHDYCDSDHPRKLERHVNFDGLPQDMLAEIAYEVVVRAECKHCGHEDLYINWPGRLDEPDCKGPGCSEQLLFPN
jgi:hypothetical protein